jgi:23S rRNA (guanosine2251-2'-O)-methyltransferase
MVKMNAKQLRDSSFVSSLKKAKSERRMNEIYIILDNVLDTYNIGAIFRLADAVAAKKVIICGASETPPNHRIKKASINTTEVVEWEYSETTVKAIKDLRLKIKDLQVVAVEQAENSVPYDKFNYKMPIALIVGHETDGVSREVLDLCDGIVEMPMFGINISLNVMVSLGIVLYKVLEESNLTK